MSMNMTTRMQEMHEEAGAILAGAEKLLANTERTAEDGEKAEKMYQDAMRIKGDIDRLMQIKAAAADIAAMADREPVQPDQDKAKKVDGTRADLGEFKSLGTMLQGVFAATFRGRSDPRLVPFVDPSEPDHAKTDKSGWLEAKDLQEAIGASGGFLVPEEQRGELLSFEPSDQFYIRDRCTVIPMRRRAIRIPVLDQTGTTAGQPHWWGGILAKWTEELGEKEETEPTFRQVQLVAHKLVCYTEAGDELLADAGISLAAFLGSAFRSVVRWYEEYAYLRGTGAGQPLGVIGAPVTLVEPRSAAGSFDITDIINMVEQFQGRSPVWIASRQCLSNLMLLNGPTGNASYIFMPSARDAMPHNLFGYPLFFSEACPAPGTEGDLGLYDWKYYVAGDRDAITVDSSKHFRFQNDITAWRAVRRVAGMPWMSAPITYQDGSTQVSPFVVLGDYTGS